ncbi:hypothetical protein T492DRAFT_838620 [Pavlovales sp. CCMP2436]|nr:hypothetical protein T492DRAFT_838620 [Pavlovales sp. CCMP2436]
MSRGRASTTWLGLFALAAQLGACVSKPEPPPPYMERRSARLSGQLLGSVGQPVVAEAIASTAHTLVIRLVNETFVPAISSADLIASLSGAGDGDEEKGWDRLLESSRISWVRATDNRTLVVTVLQLRDFSITQDATIRVSLSPALLSSSAVSNDSRTLAATPAVHIRAEYPCADLSVGGCAGCIGYNAAGSNRTHTCAWCPSDKRCLAQTDLGISGSQCSGLTVDQCGAPDDPAGGGTSPASAPPSEATNPE